MPTIFRVSAVVAVLAATSWGCVWALANLLEPRQREILLTVPPERFAP